MTTYRNTRYRLTVNTLTPLHIGTGRTLLRDYDYVTHKGKTWVIDEEALAETAFDRGELDRMAQGIPASDLLKPTDYEIDSPLFRYVLDGEPRSKTRGSVIQALVKNAWDEPYIPGSSLKGALRTALLFSLSDKRLDPWRIEDLNPKAKFAAQPLERKALVAPYEGRGKDPNYDFIRTLRVSDSTPDDQRRLSLINVSVVKWRGDTGAPIELEAIPRGVTLTMELTFDTYLLESPDVKRQIRWDEILPKRLKRLPDVANIWSQKRLEDEAERPRSGPWKQQFEDIMNQWEGRDADEFLIQVGWGGGWDSKTLGAKLKADPQKFAKIVNNYKLLKKGVFQPGDRFPKSRRVQIGRQDDKPRAELGWLKIKMEQIS